MIVRPVKTKRILPNTDSLEDVLDSIDQSSLELLQDNSILVVTSKIISICDGDLVKINPDDPTQKITLIKKECDRFIPPELNAYGVSLTIKNGFLIPTAGIDESNCDGFYVLWPKDPQSSANRVRRYVEEKYNRKIGVIISDSVTSPLRWGTTGTAIAHSGFQAVNSYIGKPDLFGRSLKITKSNIAIGLAAAAVVVMGEGAESTPLAIISDLPFVEFTFADPTRDELEQYKISLEDDLYAQLLIHAPWEIPDKS